jgi:hypothetical protein
LLIPFCSSELRFFIQDFDFSLYASDESRFYIMHVYSGIQLEGLLAAASNKVYQLLAHDQWFSPGTPSSSTTKTGRHDIAKILLKVALSTINQSKIIM